MSKFNEAAKKYHVAQSDWLIAENAALRGLLRACIAAHKEHPIHFGEAYPLATDVFVRLVRTNNPRLDRVYRMLADLVDGQKSA